MTLMTIIEAAKFLRLTKRTLYHRADIPHVRYGHRIMYVKEDLERWVRGLTEKSEKHVFNDEVRVPHIVDASPQKVYHRNPLFTVPRRK